MFGISREREELQRTIREQDPIWKYKFFVQRRAVKKYTAEKLVDFNEREINQALRELKLASFDETLVYDEELAVAFVTQKLVEAEESLTRIGNHAEIRETINKINSLHQLKDKTFGNVFERTSLNEESRAPQLKRFALWKFGRRFVFGRKKKMASFKVARARVSNLVHLSQPEAETAYLMRGVTKNATRGGFTQPTPRPLRDRFRVITVDCHEREKDRCSKGYAKRRRAETHPLELKPKAVRSTKNLEMHLLKRKGIQSALWRS